MVGLKGPFRSHYLVRKHGGLLRSGFTSNTETARHVGTLSLKPHWDGEMADSKSFQVRDRIARTRAHHAMLARSARVGSAVARFLDELEDRRMDAVLANSHLSYELGFAAASACAISSNTIHLGIRRL
jgi:hypothetical protein